MDPGQWTGILIILIICTTIVILRIAKYKYRNRDKTEGPDVEVMQEINRYADSEFRYSDKSDDAAVEKLVRDARLRERAIREIEEMKKNGAWDA